MVEEIKGGGRGGHCVNNASHVMLGSSVCGRKRREGEGEIGGQWLQADTLRSRGAEKTGTALHILSSFETAAKEREGGERGKKNRFRVVHHSRGLRR